LVDRAVALNSNLALAWKVGGWVSLYLGQHEEALRRIDRSIRLNPIDPENYGAEIVRALALLLLGNYDDACQCAAQVNAYHPNYAVPYRVLAAGNALAGRFAEAQEPIRLLRSIDPEMRLSRLKEFLPYNRPEDIARFIEGFRLAGMPE
jgi:tetratricopeptide (TPR) repeat protein